MATAKKVPAKKSVAQLAALKRSAAKKVVVKAPTKAPAKPAEPPQEFRMPAEVKEWIEQATSRMRNLQSKIDRLESENTELKSYKKWAEHRLLGTSQE